MLRSEFFDRDACVVAKELLGKVIFVRAEHAWLTVKIIETEAYYLDEKASHASLGYTEKRRALFMSAGTIYMYYSRAGDSMNVSCAGEGNAVLIKSGIVYSLAESHSDMISLMQKNNPAKNSSEPRDPQRLCSGQTLLCKSLGITVKEWDAQQFDSETFFIKDTGYQPENILITTRLGISPERDAHLPYRFIDEAYVEFCTKKPVKE